MGDTKSKKSGTSMSVGNPPNWNGNGKEWENFGNLFLDPTGKRGTLYLRASVEQLQKLIEGATDGQVNKKVGVFLSKSKGGAEGGGAPAAPQAAA
ncbi:MAG TPA: hypothetical protein VFU23_11580 [Gemmatimonadales bacterium]|nr:hypothetical protein [Gemmatimonadales bacterium]